MATGHAFQFHNRQLPQLPSVVQVAVLSCMPFFEKYQYYRAMDYAQTPTHEIVRPILFLSYQDRYKDWLFHSTPFECYVNREHLRDRLDYCFINRIRDAVPDRINDYDCIYSRPHKPVPPEMASGNKTYRHTEQQ